MTSMKTLNYEGMLLFTTSVADNKRLSATRKFEAMLNARSIRHGELLISALIAITLLPLIAQAYA